MRARSGGAVDVIDQLLLANLREHGSHLCLLLPKAPTNGMLSLEHPVRAEVPRNDGYDRLGLGTRGRRRGRAVDPPPRRRATRAEARRHSAQPTAPGTE